MEGKFILVLFGCILVNSFSMGYFLKETKRVAPDPNKLRFKITLVFITIMVTVYFISKYIPKESLAEKYSNEFTIGSQVVIVERKNLKENIEEIKNYGEKQGYKLKEISSNEMIFEKNKDGEINE